MNPGLLLFLGAAANPLAVPAPKPAAPASALAPRDPFALVEGDYKPARVVPDSFFNPFHIRALGDDDSKKDRAAVTDESVTAAVGHRGVSGLFVAPHGGGSRILIGDQVFAPGDELAFPGADGEPEPLIKGAIVILRAIGPDSLGLEVTPPGESPRRVVFSLRSFRRL